MYACPPLRRVGRCGFGGRMLHSSSCKVIWRLPCSMFNCREESYILDGSKSPYSLTMLRRRICDNFTTKSFIIHLVLIRMKFLHSDQLTILKFCFVHFAISSCSNDVLVILLRLQGDASVLRRMSLKVKNP